jgi:hypothetical protein
VGGSGKTEDVLLQPDAKAEPAERTFARNAPTAPFRLRPKDSFTPAVFLAATRSRVGASICQPLGVRKCAHSETPFQISEMHATLRSQNRTTISVHCEPGTLNNFAEAQALAMGKQMQIVVSLNTQVTDAADIRAELDAELHGLEQDQDDLHIKTQKKEVEAGTLGLFEAYQFIVEYGPTAVAAGLPLVTAVLQLSNAILQRSRIGRMCEHGEVGNLWHHLVHQPESFCSNADAGHQNSQRRSVVFEPSPILTKLIHDVPATRKLLPRTKMAQWNRSTFSPARLDFALVRLH